MEYNQLQHRASMKFINLRGSQVHYDDASTSKVESINDSLKPTTNLQIYKLEDAIDQIRQKEYRHSQRMKEIKQIKKR
jgi:hypothetical protein